MSALDRRRGLLAAVAAAVGLAAGFAVVLLSVDTDAEEPAAQAGEVISEPTTTLPASAPPTSLDSAVAPSAPTTLEAVAIDQATTTTSTTTTRSTTTSNTVTSVTTVPASTDTAPPECGVPDQLASVLLVHDEPSRQFEEDWESALDEWLQFVVGDGWATCKGQIREPGEGDRVMCVKNGNAGSVGRLTDVCVDLLEPGEASGNGTGGAPASVPPPPTSCAAPDRYGLILISSTNSDDEESRFDAVTKNVLSDFVNVFGNRGISSEQIESCKQAVVDVLEDVPVRCVYVGDPAVKGEISADVCSDLAEFGPGDRPASTSTNDGN